MHHAGVQFGQQPSAMSTNQVLHYQANAGAAPAAHSSAPSVGGAPHHNTSIAPSTHIHHETGSTATLRQWRKKDDKFQVDASESQGPIARVAPHAHNPLPRSSLIGGQSGSAVGGAADPAAYHHAQNMYHSINPYQYNAMPLHDHKNLSQVKYSEIVEPHQGQQVTPVIQKQMHPVGPPQAKDKDYMMCSVVEQNPQTQVSGLQLPHHVHGLQTGPTGHTASGTSGQVKCYYTSHAKESHLNHLHPHHAPQHPVGQQYHQKDYTQNYKLSQYQRTTLGMSNQYTDYLGFYGNSEIAQPYPYGSRPPAGNFRNYRNYTGVPPGMPNSGINSGYTTNVQNYFPSGSSGSSSGTMGSVGIGVSGKVPQDIYRTNAYGFRNISPRRIYPDVSHYPPRVSPNCYNPAQHVEYAQHYQNRRDYPVSQIQNSVDNRELIGKFPSHHLPDQSLGHHHASVLDHLDPEAGSSKASNSLKQFIEGYNPESVEESKRAEQQASAQAVQLLPQSGVLPGPVAAVVAPPESLYILDSTEISSEQVGEYIHLQVDKLPENIKGFYGSNTVITSPLNLTQDSVIKDSSVVTSQGGAQPNSGNTSNISVISEVKKFVEKENHSPQGGQPQGQSVSGTNEPINSVIVFGEHNKAENVDENRNLTPHSEMLQSLTQTTSTDTSVIKTTGPQKLSESQNDKPTEPSPKSTDFQSPRTLEEIPKPLNEIEQFLDDSVNGDVSDMFVLSERNEKDIKVPENMDKSCGDIPQAKENVSLETDVPLAKKSEEKEEKPVAKTEVPECETNKLTDKSEVLEVKGDSVQLRIGGEVLNITLVNTEIQNKLRKISIKVLSDCDVFIDKPTLQSSDEPAKALTEEKISEDLPENDDPEVAPINFEDSLVKDDVPTPAIAEISEKDDSLEKIELIKEDSPQKIELMKEDNPEKIEVTKEDSLEKIELMKQDQNEDVKNSEDVPLEEVTQLKSPIFPMDADMPDLNSQTEDTTEVVIQPDSNLEMPELDAEEVYSPHSLEAMLSDNCNEIIIEDQGDLSLSALDSPMSPVIPLSNASEEPIFEVAKDDSDTEMSEEIKSDITEKDTVEKEDFESQKSEETKLIETEKVMEESDEVLHKEEPISDVSEVQNEQPVTTPESPKKEESSHNVSEEVPKSEESLSEKIPSEEIPSEDISDVPQTEPKPDQEEVAQSKEPIEDTNSEILEEPEGREEIPKLKEVRVQLRESDREEVRKYLSRLRRTSQAESESNQPNLKRKRVSSEDQPKRLRDLKSSEKRRSSSDLDDNKTENWQIRNLCKSGESAPKRIRNNSESSKDSETKKRPIRRKSSLSEKEPIRRLSEVKEQDKKYEKRKERLSIDESISSSEKVKEKLRLDKPKVPKPEIKETLQKKSEKEKVDKHSKEDTKLLSVDKDQRRHSKVEGKLDPEKSSTELGSSSSFISEKHNFSILSKDEKTKTKIKTPSSRNRKLESLVESSVKILKGEKDKTDSLQEDQAEKNTELDKILEKKIPSPKHETPEIVKPMVKTKAQLKEAPSVEVLESINFGKVSDDNEDKLVEISSEDIVPVEVPSGSPSEEPTLQVAQSPKKAKNTISMSLIGTDRKKLSLAEYKKKRSDQLPSLDDIKPDDVPKPVLGGLSDDYETHLEKILDAPNHSKLNIPAIIETIPLDAIRLEEIAPIVITLEIDKDSRPTDPRRKPAQDTVDTRRRSYTQTSDPPTDPRLRPDLKRDTNIYSEKNTEKISETILEKPGNDNVEKLPEKVIDKVPEKLPEVLSLENVDKSSDQKPKCPENVPEKNLGHSEQKSLPKPKPTLLKSELKPKQSEQETIRQSQTKSRSISSSDSGSDSNSGSETNTDSSSSDSDSSGSSDTNTDSSDSSGYSRFENIHLNKKLKKVSDRKAKSLVNSQTLTDLNKEIDNIFSLSQKKFEIRPRRTGASSENDSEPAPSCSSQRKRFLINLDEIKTNLDFSENCISMKNSSALPSPPKTKKKKLLIDPDDFNLDDEVLKSSSDSDREVVRNPVVLGQTRIKNIIDLNELLPAKNSLKESPSDDRKYHPADVFMEEDEEEMVTETDQVSEFSRNKEESDPFDNRNIDCFMNKEPPIELTSQENIQSPKHADVPEVIQKSDDLSEGVFSDNMDIVKIKQTVQDVSQEHIEPDSDQIMNVQEESESLKESDETNLGKSSICGETVQTLEHDFVKISQNLDHLEDDTKMDVEDSKYSEENSGEVLGNAKSECTKVVSSQNIREDTVTSTETNSEEMEDSEDKKVTTSLKEAEIVTENCDISQVIVSSENKEDNLVKSDNSENFKVCQISEESEGKILLTKETKNPENEPDNVEDMDCSDQTKTQSLHQSDEVEIFKNTELSSEENIQKSEDLQTELIAEIDQKITVNDLDKNEEEISDISSEKINEDNNVKQSDDFVKTNTNVSEVQISEETTTSVNVPEITNSVEILTSSEDAESIQVNTNSDEPKLTDKHLEENLKTDETNSEMVLELPENEDLKEDLSGHLASSDLQVIREDSEDRDLSKDVFSPEDSPIMVPENQDSSEASNHSECSESSVTYKESSIEADSKNMEKLLCFKDISVPTESFKNKEDSESSQCNHSEVKQVKPKETFRIKEYFTYKETTVEDEIPEAQPNVPSEEASESNPESSDSEVPMNLSVNKIDSNECVLDLTKDSDTPSSNVDVNNSLIGNLKQSSKSDKLSDSKIEQVTLPNEHLVKHASPERNDADNDGAANIPNSEIPEIRQSEQSQAQDINLNLVGCYRDDILRTNDNDFSDNPTPSQYKPNSVPVITDIQKIRDEGVCGEDLQEDTRSFVQIRGQDNVQGTVHYVDNDDQEDDDISCTIEETKMIFRNLRKGTKKLRHSENQDSGVPNIQNDTQAEVGAVPKKKTIDDISKRLMVDILKPDDYSTVPQNPEKPIDFFPETSILKDALSYGEGNSVSLWGSGFPPCPPFPNLSSLGNLTNLGNLAMTSGVSNYLEAIKWHQWQYYHQMYYYQQSHLLQQAQQAQTQANPTPNPTKEYGVMSSGDLKMKLHRIQPSHTPDQDPNLLAHHSQSVPDEEVTLRKRRRRRREDTEGSTDEPDDYLVVKTRGTTTPTGIPKLIIKRSNSTVPNSESDTSTSVNNNNNNNLTTIDHNTDKCDLMPIVRLERDPQLDILAYSGRRRRKS